jgi:hypothetical protein
MQNIVLGASFIKTTTVPIQNIVLGVNQRKNAHTGANPMFYIVRRTIFAEKLAKTMFCIVSASYM